ncbi:MAG: hypothetical protein AB1428_13980 [Bacteroidota bacterium]
MSEKKRFLLRLDAAIYDALEKWAADDLRSVNAQIEFLLTEAARRAGRLRPPAPGGGAKRREG